MMITDNWLKVIDNKKIVGAVLLDFSAAFDIIDNVCVMAFQSLPYSGFKAIYSI